MVSKGLFKMTELRSFVPARYIFAVLGFFGFFNVYAMRVNLSVAMVAMVNDTTDNGNDECPSNQQDADHGVYLAGEHYDWDAKEQGLILGSFFYGYVTSQLPGAYVAEKYGAKWVFGLGVAITASLSMITPLAAHVGISFLIAVRVLEGLAEGVTFPAMNLLISKWSPISERSRVSTVIFTGAQMGNVIAMPISGWLSASPLGWPSVFYVFGVVGCIWFIFWCFLVYESPPNHPRINKKELALFEIQQKTVKRPPLPWKALIKSLPMWSVIIAHVGHNWGFLILLTEMPSYMSSILHFDVKADGFLSALPYAVQAISAWIASLIADYLRKSGHISITCIRKICNTIGLIGPGLCLIGVANSGCNPVLNVAFLSAAMALNGFIYSGFNVTHLEMSPKHAATLFGITNCISNICGIVGPSIVGYFTAEEATIANWGKVFYLTTGIYIVTALFYAIFASAEKQPWAEEEEGKV